MRPRNALLAACPWLSREDASEALRHAGGDVEKAKRAVSAARRLRRPEDADDVGRRCDPSVAERPNAVAAEDSLGNILNNNSVSQTRNDDNNDKKPSSPLPRAPPRHNAPINNLSDRQYCCVWSVEVYDDGYRPDVARALLANVARHVNPILRDRGWRVKRLIESASTQWIGLCTTNGRGDADAASTNIQLNLRVRPDRKCKQFRSFPQILAVMLHEITHTSIGLEDIHPPAFWELLNQIKREYREKLAAGEVDHETDDYGCNGQYISSSGDVASISKSASDILGDGIHNLNLLGEAGSEGDCGASKRRRRRRNGNGWKRKPKNYSAGYTSNVSKKEKKRPLRKGAKMVDKRTKVGKAVMAERENRSARDLAAKAAMNRLGSSSSLVSASYDNAKLVQDLTFDSSSENDSENEAKSFTEESKISDDEEVDENYNDEQIEDHDVKCSCRYCDWSKLFLLD